jgi:hypothetical protein
LPATPDRPYRAVPGHRLIEFCDAEIGTRTGRASWATTGPCRAIRASSYERGCEWAYPPAKAELELGWRGHKPQLDLEYWSLVLAGVGTVEACRQVGIGRKTGYRWREERGGIPHARACTGAKRLVAG